MLSLGDSKEHEDSIRMAINIDNMAGAKCIIYTFNRRLITVRPPVSQSPRIDLHTIQYHQLDPVPTQTLYKFIFQSKRSLRPILPPPTMPLYLPLPHQRRHPQHRLPPLLQPPLHCPLGHPPLNPLPHPRPLRLQPFFCSALASRHGVSDRGGQQVGDFVGVREFHEVGLPAEGVGGV